MPAAASSTTSRPSAEEKAGVKFNHVPYLGAVPAVVALLGGHIDALNVSPTEGGPHVLGGKLKMLRIMADQRVPAFGKVPTFKERKIDLALGSSRGLAVHKARLAPVLEVLRQVARKTSDDPALRQSLDKLKLGFSYLDALEFTQAMQRDHEYFGNLIRSTGVKI